MPPRRTPRNSSGQFAPAEDAVADYKVNVQAKAGQSSRNAIGAAENALLLAEVVKTLITPGASTDQHEKARSIIASMGDLKGPTTSLNIITADHVPESESPQLGSAIRAAYSSGGSATTGSRFNDNPIPIDLTQSPSNRKRRATKTANPKPDSGEDLLGALNEPATTPLSAIAVVPRP
ncbi:hypothetical protein FPHYL_13000 [Fusarium phyllophilum]|uniref:Uncharacterized protein n=1 Tax=Fusarium phyllophilum TaxID=47803 RepID=A0A8H5IIB7_9HYPO|nr:hypothetical protein FPHYL_13000 [Fusarium phyllophilum]